MARKKQGEDRGRCAYCMRVCSTPRKVAYEPSADGSHSRYSHHRSRVFMGGVEVLPLCAFSRPRPSLSTWIGDR